MLNDLIFYIYNVIHLLLSLSVKSLLFVRFLQELSQAVEPEEQQKSSAIFVQNLRHIPSIFISTCIKNLSMPLDLPPLKTGLYQIV